MLEKKNNSLKKGGKEGGNEWGKRKRNSPPSLKRGKKERGVTVDFNWKE